MTLAINAQPEVSTPPEQAVQENIDWVDATPVGAPHGEAPDLATAASAEADHLVWDGAAAAAVARGIILATAAEHRGRQRLANHNRAPRGSNLKLAAARANHELRGIEWDKEDTEPKPQ